MNKLKELDVIDGVTQIPDGYAWCSECKAISPHEKGKYSSIRCIICDTTTYISISCPNCHAETPEDIAGPGIAVVHHDGCHCKEFCYEDSNGYDVTIYDYAKQIAEKFKDDYLKPFPERSCYCLPDDNGWYIPHKKLMDKWQSAYNIKCGCPRYVIYKTPQIFNYQSHSVYSMDCMNAMEWSYDVRCHVCGYIYYESDGNC